mmetsp:Transcript_20387/g.31842  ORF Transcript_20387/g.31842 Transcript_20387/m.31842 type:complete len:86 (+) Transcript_20387:305-562(+)
MLLDSSKHGPRAIVHGRGGEKDLGTSTTWGFATWTSGPDPWSRLLTPVREKPKPKVREVFYKEGQSNTPFSYKGRRKTEIQDPKK